MSCAGPPPLSQQQRGDALANNDLKNAAQVMFLYAFFLALPAAIVVAMSTRMPDKYGIIMMLLVGLCVGFLVAAGVLLMKRRKAGLILTWVAMPLMLLAFPIGTFAGAYVLAKLGKQGVRGLLK